MVDENQLIPSSEYAADAELRTIATYRPNVDPIPITPTLLVTVAAFPRAETPAADVNMAGVLMSVEAYTFPATYRDVPEGLAVPTPRNEFLVKIERVLRVPTFAEVVAKTFVADTAFDMNAFPETSRALPVGVTPPIPRNCPVAMLKFCVVARPVTFMVSAVTLGATSAFDAKTFPETYRDVPEGTDVPTPKKLEAVVKMAAVLSVRTFALVVA
jgi:hypothetical protein